MLNEVFLDHMDKKGMITSFRNTIDFSLSVRLKGVKITRERGITCSQAFNRVYFTGKIFSLQATYWCITRLVLSSPIETVARDLEAHALAFIAPS